MSSIRRYVEECPSADDLQAFVIGRLADRDASELERHLEQCEACSKALAELSLGADALVVKLRDSDANDPSHSLTRASDAAGNPSSTMAPKHAASGASATPPTPKSATGTIANRYRKISELGNGAFGVVWLAEDLELRRQVALKEPHPHRLLESAEVAAYIAEAQTLASLDHPHIVPVFDVGRTPEGSCYVVSKLIDGLDLAAYAKKHPLSFDQTAQMLAKVADALQHTHSRGLVHRDIKSANILVDWQGRPYVADFGLALRDEDFGKANGFAGTPSYMSPEQARGEGHLIDGRSDIFSLGVVLYELLTGARPFVGSGWEAVLQQIISVDAKPLRQRNDAIPRELERICLKCLSKRAADRYTCAADLAEDLRRWSEVKAVEAAAPAVVRIVPKGLRSFDATDRDFFLELLPGPRDREGLPETLRFWKSKIEETDADQTFRVGLVYGPSGCGKSSLMKAGLLPRLADHVLGVFLEATPDDTEKHLLQRLRKLFADLPNDAGLTETLSAIRRGKGPPPGRKLVLVFDQFEQWLYTHGAEPNSELAAALRQCDGQRIQAVLLVRDDFYRDANRLMQRVEVPLREGHNQALVDLFDPLHARKVLAAFGKAYGRLPENLGNLSKPENDFLDQAIAGLTQEGKIICVRLALFADMMKGRPWTPAALSEVGGTAGVGATFLEETFSSRTAPPQHRHHQAAAREVLKALLPHAGADIKGHFRSASELRDAAGYASRPDDFAELIRILDSEVRLITPATVEGKEPAYQLTHDYLVPSLRDWLTRKQRETRRGRAELRLAELSDAWNAKPENRLLPTFSDYAAISAFTSSKSWTEPQRRWMRAGGWLIAVRSALLLAIFGAVLVIGVAIRGQVVQRQEATRMEGLVEQLVSAEPSQLLDTIKKLDANSTIASRYLAPLLAAKAETPEEQRALRHARLAAVGRDLSLVDPLAEELLSGKLAYVAPIRRRLRPAAARLRERFQAILRDEQAPAERRFRAALTLADHVPKSQVEFWTPADLSFIARQLVAANAEFQPVLRDLLRPIDSRLTPEIETIFADEQSPDGQRLSAANALADYAAKDLAKLTKLLAVATSEQFAVLYPIVAAAPPSDAIAELVQLVAEAPAVERTLVERVSIGQRRANAAVTLLRLGEREKIFPVFQMSDDPEALTQFIFRCRARGARADDVLECLRIVSQGPLDRFPKDARHALLLALGEFTLNEVPESSRDELLERLRDWYANDPSSGVHGAAGWLLRHWQQFDIVRQVDEVPVPYTPDCEWFNWTITVQPTAPAPTDAVGSPAGENPAPAAAAPKTFSFTFVVFPAGEYELGSVADEPDRQKDERRHRVKLTRPFAVLDREITMEELIAFSPQYTVLLRQFDAAPETAAFGVDWYDAVGFCRWLGRQAGLPESDQCYVDPSALDPVDHPREPNPSANWAPRNWRMEPGRRGFRLPTETEWEVAARAGTRSVYSFGSEASLLRQFGWYAANSRKHAHAPRMLRPGLRGLFDMHGNQFEWTNDWHAEFSDVVVVDSLGGAGGASRVYRGGSWFSGAAANCRSADRNACDPTDRSNNLGLRLALSPAELRQPPVPEKRQEPIPADKPAAPATPPTTSETP